MENEQGSTQATQAYRVRKLLRTSGGEEVTQEQFANLIGVTFVTLNRWENSHAEPRDDNREMLALLERLLLAHPPETVWRILMETAGHRARQWARLGQLEIQNP